MPILLYESLKKRKTKRGVEYLVNFIGYPESMNQWVKASDLKNQQGYGMLREHERVLIFVKNEKKVLIFVKNEKKVLIFVKNEKKSSHFRKK